jgi:hypothetical protein
VRTAGPVPKHDPLALTVTLLHGFASYPSPGKRRCAKPRVELGYVRCPCELHILNRLLEGSHIKLRQDAGKR